MSFLFNLFKKIYNYFKNLKKNMAGFNQNNNYTLYLTAYSGETLHDVLK